MKQTENKGITLIALVITIIVMLILIGVTINLSLDGGLFGYAKQAKNNTEITNEKEIIQNAIIMAKGTNKTGKITAEEMQKKIDEETVTILEDGNNLIIKFNQSNRLYEVDQKGNVEGPKELVKDEYAGDITKNGEYDGSKSKPFKITCIEDLVEFAIMTAGGDKTLNLASNKFTNQYIELTRTLDFQSMFSYNDYKTTKYGDLNKDGVIEGIKIELTKTKENCIGFSGIAKFEGEFNGNENEIANIYMNTTFNSSDIGLFKNITGATIKNLGITGKIISGRYAGGIVCNAAGGNCKIENCYNKADIVAEDATSIARGTAGICGTLHEGIISNCYNIGTIEGNSCIGGIVGGTNNATIENCYNEGNIISNGSKAYTGAGGIAGMMSNNTNIVKNCYNKGNVYGKGTASSGGILGRSRSGGSCNLTIINCSNLKEIMSESTAGGIAGGLSTANASSLLIAKILNCYNVGNINNDNTDCRWNSRKRMVRRKC